MKTIKFALLTLALLAPAALVAQMGGREGSHRGMASVDDQVKQLSKELKLTDDQTSQVKTILQDQSDQMKKVMQDSSGQRDDNWSRMRDIHEKSSAQIRTLLTDEQKTKYDKMQEERRQRMQERHHGNEEAPPAQPQGSA
jgi:Spy/CpxP family protein refolding chaperone